MYIDAVSAIQGLCRMWIMRHRMDRALSKEELHAVNMLQDQAMAVMLYPTEEELDALESVQRRVAMDAHHQELGLAEQEHT